MAQIVVQIDENNQLIAEGTWVPDMPISYFINKTDLFPGKKAYFHIEKMTYKTALMSFDITPLFQFFNQSGVILWDEFIKYITEMYVNKNETNSPDGQKIS